MSVPPSPKGSAHFIRRCAGSGPAWCLVGIAVAFSVKAAVAQPAPTSPSAGQPVSTSQAIPTPEAIEEEVYQNVLNQSLDGQTVPDLNMPEPFLKRVADRAVRLSYEKRYRIVVQDGPTVGPSQSGSTPRATSPAGSTKWLAVTVLSLVAVVVVIAAWGFNRRLAR